MAKKKSMFSGLKKGALHKQLGVAEKDTIPQAKLEAAANSSNALTKKRAQFAINAKKFNRPKKKAAKSPPRRVLSSVEKKAARDLSGKNPGIGY